MTDDEVLHEFRNILNSEAAAELQYYASGRHAQSKERLVMLLSATAGIPEAIAEALEDERVGRLLKERFVSN